MLIVYSILQYKVRFKATGIKDDLRSKCPKINYKVIITPIHTHTRTHLNNPNRFIHGLGVLNIPAIYHFFLKPSQKEKNLKSKTF